MTWRLPCCRAAGRSGVVSERADDGSDGGAWHAHSAHEDVLLQERRVAAVQSAASVCASVHKDALLPKRRVAAVQYAASVCASVQRFYANQIQHS